MRAGRPWGPGMRGRRRATRAAVPARASALALLLPLLLSCGGEGEAGDAVAAGGDAELPGLEGAGAVESPPVASGEDLDDLTFEAADDPGVDWATAAAESEPNDEPEQATALGVQPVSSAARGGTGGESGPGVAAGPGRAGGQGRPGGRSADASGVLAPVPGSSQFAGTGELSGRETDWFRFELDGPFQLYRLHVEGSPVERVRVYEPSGTRHEAHEHGDAHVLTALHLGPGSHRVSVESFGNAEDGTYTLRVVPMGPPGRHWEREPNDTRDRADGLEWDLVRAGFLATGDDTDRYRFFLSAPTHVELRVEPPDSLALRFEIEGPVDLDVPSSTGEPGQPVRFAALLEPGKYHIRVEAAEDPSARAYRIRMTRLNRFDLPADVEPNGEPWSAKPVPRSRAVEGTLGTFGDRTDLYRLPAVPEETTLRVRVREGSPSLYVYTYDVDGRRRSTSLDDVDDTLYTAVLAPAVVPYLALERYEGPYALEVELDPSPEPSPDGLPVPYGAPALPVEATLVEGPHRFAAFWSRSQRREVGLRIENPSDEALDLILEAAMSHRAWRVEPPAGPLRLEPGATVMVPLEVRAAPDVPGGLPVGLDVALRSADGRRSTASIGLYAACGVQPVGEGDRWTVPAALRGGFDVAWSGLGARPVPRSARDLAEELTLYDGVVPVDGGWYEPGAELPLELTVDLAGEEAVPVAGMMLSSLANDALPRQWVREFELHLSEDGTAFEPALAAQAARVPDPQYFVLDAPVAARAARLVVHSTWGHRDDVAIGELAVITTPDAPLPAESPVNLADPARGAYVVWSMPAASRYDGMEAILTEEAESPTLRVSPMHPTEWVVGFHHGRAARITALEWVAQSEDARYPPLTRVRVGVSVTSPTGPWQHLGTWELDSLAGPLYRMDLDEPVWARWVRFSSSEAPARGAVGLPETIRIFEAPAGARYRSILAEWGFYASDGPYEAFGPGSHAGSEESAPAADNTSRERALALEPGRSYADAVSRGGRVAWYEVDVPAGHNRLRVTLRGRPVADVSATLEDEGGNELPLQAHPGTGPDAVVSAEVQGGAAYRLRLEEPVRNVVIAWDNSGSVRPFAPVVYPALADFLSGVRPGDERIQLLPFGSPFLLDDWSGDPGELGRALSTYDRTDDDSDAETALLEATRELAGVDGARAVLLLADAETFSYDDTPELWEALGAVAPRIFTVELHRGTGARHQQDLMQGWAHAAGGHYAWFADARDLPMAFDRAFCHLRRPVRFTISAETRYEAPPPPGGIAVESSELPYDAVELVLDASGSMLRRLNGVRRIEIARDVLSELVSTSLPAGTPLALRVFGHRTPDACDTDLVLPLDPLDPSEVVPVLRGTEAMNLARTPIGESLRLVGEDLGDVDGPALVILITDGEETCEGDPAAAIRSLQEGGLDARVNIVGFAIDDRALRADFERWAELGGGLYYDAASAEELQSSLEEALRPKFQVVDEAGDVAAQGVAGGSGVSVPVGTYTVRLLTSPVRVFEDVRVESERTTRLEPDPPER